MTVTKQHALIEMEKLLAGEGGAYDWDDSLHSQSMIFNSTRCESYARSCLDCIRHPPANTATTRALLGSGK